MTKDEFRNLMASGYSHIPVTREVLADLDTPLSVYLKLARGDYSYLLESAQGGEKWGRYSIIGLPSRTILKVAGYEVTVTRQEQIIEQLNCEDPMGFIESFQSRYRVPDLPEMPRFYGGLVGYFGYDCVRYAEPRLADSAPPDPLGSPDILLMVSEEVIVFDNLKGTMHIICLADTGTDNAFEQAQARIEEIAARMHGPLPELPRSSANQMLQEEDFDSEFPQQAHAQAVEKIREYIHAGDVMQVVLAQRMSTPFTSEPINLYRALRSLNPSPYMYFMDLKEFQIVSSSPEILARVDDGVIVNRPLAGTRRRGHDQAEDLALEKELLSDPKELAEHLMLIDLGRNDVGRVAETGSVEVTEQFAIERYSHVMHISSNVVGKLRKDKTAMDVLKAALPVGTLSGAPKIRAMQIIDELEPVKRGIYGGAVGYISWNGNMDTAIAIRTAVLKDGRLYIEAGGGIVADSLANLEWKESMNKGRAIFRAAALAENDFHDG